MGRIAIVSGGNEVGYVAKVICSEHVNKIYILMDTPAVSTPTIEKIDSEDLLANWEPYYLEDKVSKYVEHSKQEIVAVIDNCIVFIKKKIEATLIYNRVSRRLNCMNRIVKEFLEKLALAESKVIINGRQSSIRPASKVIVKIKGE